MLEVGGPVLAAGDHPGGTVFLGEVGHRPDRVALRMHVGREREEVECPLVAVDRLTRRAGADRRRQRTFHPRQVAPKHLVHVKL